MAGNEQGFAMGMNNAYMSIGNVLGPMLAGMLYDVKLIYPFVLGLVLLVLTLFTTIVWQKRSIHIKLVINSLPEDLRKVIILRYFGGFTISETAEILGIPDGTVSTRTRKALEVLRVEISD